MNSNTHLWLYVGQLFLKWKKNDIDKINRENQNTRNAQ